jgi:hypothetical protein
LRAQRRNTLGGRGQGHYPGFAKRQASDTHPDVATAHDQQTFATKSSG